MSLLDILDDGDGQAAGFAIAVSKVTTNDLVALLNFSIASGAITMTGLGIISPSYSVSSAGYPFIMDGSGIRLGVGMDPPVVIDNGNVQTPLVSLGLDPNWADFVWYNPTAPGALPGAATVSLVGAGAAGAGRLYDSVYNPVLPGDPIVMATVDADGVLTQVAPFPLPHDGEVMFTFQSHVDGGVGNAMSATMPYMFVRDNLGNPVYSTAIASGAIGIGAGPVSAFYANVSLKVHLNAAAGPFTADIGWGGGAAAPSVFGPTGSGAFDAHVLAYD